MKEETQNSLVTATNKLQSNLFEGDSATKQLTTLDLTNEEQSDLLLNSMQNVDYKINDVIGQSIEVVGCYITERDKENGINEETGEVKFIKKHTLMLFDETGKSYVTGSNSCYYSFANIVAIKGMPTADNHLTLTPIKVNAKVSGHTYLKLQLAKKGN